MTKTAINQMISHMQKAGIVTKAAPWMIEGFGDKEMNVRYVGIKPPLEWTALVSEKNNFLIKFVFDKQTSYMDFFLANKPPFIKIVTKSVGLTDKWEVLLGDIKRRLNKDKVDYQHHKDNLGNLYTLIAPHLK